MQNEYILHLRFVTRHDTKDVVVLHELEDARDHRVLKGRGPVHRCNLTGELVPESEVFRSPRHSLSELDQTGSDSAHRYSGFSTVNVSDKVNLDTPGKIETSFDWRSDARDFLQGHHGGAYFVFELPKRPCSGCIRVVALGPMPMS